MKALLSFLFFGAAGMQTAGAASIAYDCMTELRDGARYSVKIKASGQDGFDKVEITKLVGNNQIPLGSIDIKYNPGPGESWFVSTRHQDVIVATVENSRSPSRQGTVNFRDDHSRRNLRLSMTCQ